MTIHVRLRPRIEESLLMGNCPEARVTVPLSKEDFASVTVDEIFSVLYLSVLHKHVPRLDQVSFRSVGVAKYRSNGGMLLRDFLMPDDKSELFEVEYFWRSSRRSRTRRSKKLVPPDEVCPLGVTKSQYLRVRRDTMRVEF